MEPLIASPTSHLIMASPQETLKKILASMVIELFVGNKKGVLPFFALIGYWRGVWSCQSNKA